MFCLQIPVKLLRILEPGTLKHALVYKHQSSLHSRLREEGKPHFVGPLPAGSVNARSDHLKAVLESLNDSAKILQKNL